MYRIMLVKSERENYQSLYQYLTTTVDGEVSPKEFETKDELDEYVEELLNDGGYAKSDFIIINHIDYSIDALNYTDDDSSDSDDSTSIDSDELDEILTEVLG